MSSSIYGIVQTTPMNKHEEQEQEQQQWFQQEEGALELYLLSFLDVKTLLHKETVSKTWRTLSETTFRKKCCGRPKTFESKQELKDAIMTFFHYPYRGVAMEEIACTYGYPIDSWDVSQIWDMSMLFERLYSFNKYIGSWNVSRVRNMSYMFRDATSFNQKSIIGILQM
jgi:hypothetical protein